MAFSKEYRAYVEERLGAVATITSKAMFGGVGVYREGVFFAIIDEDRLYFKAGPLNVADYDARDMPWFVPYESASPMPYREVPVDVLENPKELSVWIEKAVAVAESKKKKK